MRDGAWKVGGLLLARSSVLWERRGELEPLFGGGHEPLHLARLLGLPTLLSVLVRRATVPQLERRISQVLGCRMVTVVSRHPEVAFDVDHPANLRHAAEWAQRASLQRELSQGRARQAA